MLKREFINQPTERFPRCHCSTIVQLPSGDLLAAWYAGSAEARPDVAVVASRKPKGAAGWEPCQIVSDTPGKPEGNCVLFVAPDEKLWVFFGVMHGKLNGPPGPGVRWVTCDVRCKTSSDEGRTWAPAANTDLPNPYAAIDMVKLADGRVALAFNNNEHHRNPLTLALSEDEGETWPYMRDVVTGEGNFSYPAIIEDSEGLLHLTYTHCRQHIAHIVLTPDWIKQRI